MIRAISFGMSDYPRPRSPAQLEALRRARAKVCQVGERNANAKLTEAQVRRIIRLRADGVRPTVLARRFGVDRTLIWNICTRRIWTHVA